MEKRRGAKRAAKPCALEVPDASVEVGLDALPEILANVEEEEAFEGRENLSQEEYASPPIHGTDAVKSRSSVCMQGDLDMGASVPILMEEPVTVPPPVRIGELGTSERSGRVQDWRQLFQSEKTLGSLQYFEPKRQDGKIIVQPPKEAIEEGISKWSSSLIGQFLDKPLPFYVVKRTIERIWASYGSVEVFLLDNGLFLFRFANESIREAVLEEKLWHIANKPLILRRWAPGMQLLKLSLASVPIWIKLHNLPMEFWNSTCLSHVASGIGKPICADSVTMEQCRLGFARVLVEVDVNADFPKEIELLGLNGEMNKVGIE